MAHIFLADCNSFPQEAHTSTLLSLTERVLHAAADEVPVPAVDERAAAVEVVGVMGMVLGCTVPEEVPVVVPCMGRAGSVKSRRSIESFPNSLMGGCEVVVVGVVVVTVVVDRSGVVIVVVVVVVVVVVAVLPVVEVSGVVMGLCGVAPALLMVAVAGVTAVTAVDPSVRPDNAVVAVVVVLLAAVVMVLFNAKVVVVATGVV